MSEKQNASEAGVLSSEAQDDSTSLSLLERVKTQDEEAWQRLAGLYEPLVLRWCQFQRLQDADAADVQQQVLIAVHRKISEFRREPPHRTFRGWLRSITQSKILDHWRRQKRTLEAAAGSIAQATLAELPAEIPDDSSVDEEKSLLVRRALEVLKSDFELKTWTAFWRVRIDGLPAQTVAEELQTSTAAVHTACYRVRKRLQDEFADLIDD